MLEAVQELLSKDASAIFGMKTVPNAAISIPKLNNVVSIAYIIDLHRL